MTEFILKQNKEIFKLSRIKTQEPLYTSNRLIDDKGSMI